MKPLSKINSWPSVVNAARSSRLISNAVIVNYLSRRCYCTKLSSSVPRFSCVTPSPAGRGSG